MDSPTVPPIHHLHPRRATLADWERDVPAVDASDAERAVSAAIERVHTEARQRPYEDLQEWEQKLLAATPPPSARSVLRHGTEAARLAHALMGELEWLNRHTGPLGDDLGEDVCRALLDVDRCQTVLDRVRSAAMRGVRS